MKIFAVPPDAAGMLLLELVELIDQGLYHGLSAVGLVVLPCLVQSILKH